MIKSQNFREKKKQTFFFQPVFLYGTNYISKESRALLEQSGGRRLTFSVFFDAQRRYGVGSRAMAMGLKLRWEDLATLVRT